MFLSDVPMRFLNHFDLLHADSHGWGRLTGFGIVDEAKRVTIEWDSGEIFHNVLLGDMKFVEHRGRPITLTIEQIQALEKCRNEIERFVSEEHESRQWGGPTIPPRPIDLGTLKATIPALKAIR
jgi:hypothetical protein